MNNKNNRFIANINILISIPKLLLGLGTIISLILWRTYIFKFSFNQYDNIRDIFITLFVFWFIFNLTINLIILLRFQYLIYSKSWIFILDIFGVIMLIQLWNSQKSNIKNKGNALSNTEFIDLSAYKTIKEKRRALSDYLIEGFISPEEFEDQIKLLI